MQEVQDKCHYIFDWTTNKICPSDTLNYDESKCTLTNSKLKQEVNLKDIFQSGIIGVKYSNGYLNINICNKTNSMSSAMVQYMDETVILKFNATEHSCNNKTDSKEQYEIVF